MVQAIITELEMRAKDWKNVKFNSLYFGGGTPSILNHDQLFLLMDQIRFHFELLPEAEVTLEANPDDLTSDHLSMLSTAGVNRLSIGIQSFQNRHLRWMNRSHDAEQALQCLVDARTAGFGNISTDLIYGYAGLTGKELDNDIELLTGAGVRHVSAYTMTIEPGTALQFQYRKKLYTEPPDTAVVQQYKKICTILTNAGFEHYEVSNWALPGFRSGHNSSYWTKKPYLGLGPAAHSFDGSVRSWNVANNIKYMNALANREWPAESETLSSTDVYHEYVMTGLRTAKGVNCSELTSMVGAETWKKPFDHLVKKGWLVPSSGSQQNDPEHSWRIPEEHWLMSDSIIAELFIDGQN